MVQHHGLLCLVCVLAGHVGQTPAGSISGLAIVLHHRCLDLLQCVLGFLGWSFDYQRRDPFLITYSHSLTAIVLNLQPAVVSNSACLLGQNLMASVREFQIGLPQLPSAPWKNDGHSCRAT